MSINDTIDRLIREQRNEISQRWLFTENGVNITRRLQEGQTVYTEDPFQAQKIAEAMRSYPYPVFNDRNRHVGYGIPK